jgi:ferrochelatase
MTPAPRILGVEDWGQTPALIDAFVRRVRAHAEALGGDVLARTTLVLSAHSLPKAIVDAGDPYERETRAAAASVAERVRDLMPRVRIAYQSQGMSQGPGGRPMPWLGPDLPTTLDAIAADGDTHVVFAPIGFLADHVEVLFDLDHEAKAWAAERGLTVSRAPSLNDDDDFIDVLAGLARAVLP